MGDKTIGYLKVNKNSNNEEEVEELQKVIIPAASKCEFHPDHIETLSKSILVMSESIKENTNTLSTQFADLLKVAVGKDQVPMRVFLIAIISIVAAFLGVESIRTIFGR